MKHYFFYVCLLLLQTMPTPSTAGSVTPNDVYTQTFQINEEIKILKHYFNLDEVIVVPEVKTALLPRHTWQKTYEILHKINILRQKVGLPFITVPSREPTQEVIPLHIYEQALRILTELNILKFYLGIQDQITPPSTVSGKTITDNFNLLNHISYQLDLLNGTEFNPSAVFAQAMRIHEDINMLLEALEIKDDTIPPPKQPNAISADSFQAALQLLQEIKRLQNLAHIDTIDLYAFKPNKTITPTETFGLTGIALAELQTLKAHLDLKYAFTPLANFYSDKAPADVQQMLNWSVRKIQLIQSLH